MGFYTLGNAIAIIGILVVTEIAVPSEIALLNMA